MSFGGFVEYFALIYPIVREGKFVFKMVLTRRRLEFNHWMDVNGQEQETPKAKPIVLEDIF